jgi:hypothetical protein
MISPDACRRVLGLRKEKENPKSNSKSDQAGTEFILYSVMVGFYLEDQNKCNHHRRAMDDQVEPPVTTSI